MARMLSERAGFLHHTIRLNGDFLDDYPRHAARAVYASDGLVDATTVDCLYLEQQVRNLVPVKLMGGFGSQVLGRVKPALRARPPAAALIHPDFRAQLSAVSESMGDYSSGHPLSCMLRREIPWYWSKFTVPQMSQVAVRSPFLDNDLVQMLYRAPREGYDGTAFELHAVEGSNRSLLAVRTNRGMGGNAPPGVDAVVRNIIRLRRLADRTLNWEVLPHTMHHLVSRVDRWVLSPLHLDRLFLGYECYQHYNLWFRQALARYVRDTLLDPATLQRPYWEPAGLRRIVEDHIRGRGRYLREIRKALTIELIHRTLIEGRPGA
jgi:asparagine synthase (glutamine-hydrolysing)